MKPEKHSHDNLPPPQPRKRSQGELDREAYYLWPGKRKDHGEDDVWFAAIAYERTRMKRKRTV